MKNIYIPIILAGLILTSCFEDLGNYEYTTLEEPVVTGIQDSVFQVNVGDSLHIVPSISHSLAETDNFLFDWEINIPSEWRSEIYHGSKLSIQFGLKPGLYSALLTVTDQSNEMKYFYNFQIEAKTQFTYGTFLLTRDGENGRLSFITQDSTVINYLYESFNKDLLGKNPRQIINVHEGWQPATPKSIWITCDDLEKPGVILDANNLSQTGSLVDNFFSAPDEIKVGDINVGMSGATFASINNKFYLGETRTAAVMPDYGKYPNYVAGDYELSSDLLFADFQYSLGFDTKNHRFVGFNPQGILATDYQVVGAPLYDPKEMPDFEFSHMLNAGNNYAYGWVDTTGVNTLMELTFSYNPTPMFIVMNARPFSRPDLIKENSLWIGNQLGIIYFTSGSKIYRYNPISQSIEPLSASFGSEITMIKFVPESDIILAATEGSVYYLNIGTGESGQIIAQIDGIVGAPVDAVIKK